MFADILPTVIAYNTTHKTHRHSPRQLVGNNCRSDVCRRSGCRWNATVPFHFRFYRKIVFFGHSRLNGWLEKRFLTLFQIKLKINFWCNVISPKFILTNGIFPTIVYSKVIMPNATTFLIDRIFFHIMFFNTTAFCQMAFHQMACCWAPFGMSF